MKTTVLKENFFQSRKLTVLITAFVVSFFVFTACSESETAENLETDADLISKIENAAKTGIQPTDLPALSSDVFTGDLIDTFIEKVEFAKDLGYKVFLRTDDESFTEETSLVFLSKRGRKLKDLNEKRRKLRAKCFRFVFPIDFIMPDETTITLSSKEDWTLIREWYKTNEEIEGRPKLVFPVDVTLEDNTTQTLVDREDLKEVKNSCKEGKDRRKCFKLVLPVTFTMADATEIIVNNRRDFLKIRRWHKANPDVEEKASLNFPVEIVYKDQSIATIASAEELKNARETCRD